MITSIECVVIVGSYINAYSIWRSLKALSYQKPVVFVGTGIDHGVCMADITTKGAVIVKRKLYTLEDIISVINNAVDNACRKHILFTNENYIDIISSAVADGRLQNANVYSGAGIGNEVIYDRAYFYSFIEQFDCICVPKTIESDINPKDVYGSRFVFRIKRSWQGNKKLPRLSIINNEKELQRKIVEMEDLGVTRDMWCYQELLSISDKHNISVCGWHDSQYQQYAVTRKVLQHPPKTGNGDVVETVSDYPQQLVEATNTILNAMKYAGPFEMEFVYDERDNEYKVIELNPRFWMQHGLVEELTNHSLVRRSIGMPVNEAVSPRDLPHRYWINGNQALYRLCKGQFSILKYSRNGTWYPNAWQSARWLAFYYKKYKKELSEE